MTGQARTAGEVPAVSAIPAIPAIVERPGDARFAAAVRAHEPKLAAIAARFCRDREDARDLVQDTFERALRAWDRLPEDANVRAWLITILHRRFIDRCRRARRAPAVNPDLLDPLSTRASPPPAWVNITPEQLGEALAGLDPEFRAVFELHAFGGRSYRDIAEILRIPANTVGTRLLRARKKLKELLIAQVGLDPEDLR